MRKRFRAKEFRWIPARSRRVYISTQPWTTAPESACLLFNRRTAANSVQFLELAIDEFPFPIQRIQTDRGREFFAYCFQEKLMEYGIKFRPIKPASPHLNGKVERSQRTDIEEFYATVDLKSSDLSEQLQYWQDHYNQHRPHGSLGGRTPWQIWYERSSMTPFADEVEAKYDRSAERLRHPVYQIDQQLMHTHPPAAAAHS